MDTIYLLIGEFNCESEDILSAHKTLEGAERAEEERTSFPLSEHATLYDELYIREVELEQ